MKVQFTKPSNVDTANDYVTNQMRIGMKIVWNPKSLIIEV